MQNPKPEISVARRRHVPASLYKCFLPSACCPLQSASWKVPSALQSLIAALGLLQYYTSLAENTSGGDRRNESRQQAKACHNYGSRRPGFS